MNKLVFPCLIILAQLGASCVYFCHKDYRAFAYWLFAAGINLVFTF